MMILKNVYKELKHENIDNSVKLNANVNIKM